VSKRAPSIARLLEPKAVLAKHIGSGVEADRMQMRQDLTTLSAQHATGEEGIAGKEGCRNETCKYIIQVTLHRCRLAIKLMPASVSRRHKKVGK
jgi:hypothetical protein